MKKNNSSNTNNNNDNEDNDSLHFWFSAYRSLRNISM